MYNMFHLSTYLDCFFLLLGNSLAVAKVSVFSAGQTTSFFDIGVTPSGDIVAVGNKVAGGSVTPTVYNLSSDLSSFTSHFTANSLVHRLPT